MGRRADGSVYIVNHTIHKKNKTMPDAAMQARVQELNAKMEGQAKVTFDEIERKNLRKIARKSYACVVSCFDKAGTKGSPEALQACSKNCQLPYQQANAIVNDVSESLSLIFHTTNMFLSSACASAAANTPAPAFSHSVIFCCPFATGSSTVSESSASCNDGVSGSSARHVSSRDGQ